jgi:hypothetical protein
MEPKLQIRQNAGANVSQVAPGRWRMEIPAGPAGVYRLAQLDDHLNQARNTFPWRPSLKLSLRARVSAADLPGTWGFGLWNDPFSASFGVSGTARKLPALPNAAWFFYAGPPNYLAFRDNHPAQGFLAATFSAPNLPALLLAPGALAVPLLALPATARLVRRMVRVLLGEDAALVAADATQWHDYRLVWEENSVRFFVDDGAMFSTPVAPRGSLGLVIWIDNQYAAFPPSGKLGYGTSQNPEPAWLEVENLDVSVGNAV